MNRQNIIVVEHMDCDIFIKDVQCWGNFKRACIENDLPYHSLKMKSFPIVYKDYVIRKVAFNGKNEGGI